MTTRLEEPRTPRSGAYGLLRTRVAILGGLLARAQKACAAGSIGGGRGTLATGDSVAENLAHMSVCLESIAIVLAELRDTMQVEDARARPAKRAAAKPKRRPRTQSA